jgi:hypothetical protein
MTWLLPALYALAATATILAWALALRRPEHRPIAYLLTVGLGSDAARHVLTVKVIRPAALAFGDTPWTGSARGAAIVDEVLFIAWSVAMVGAALVVFLDRRAWPALASYAALVVWIAAAHPMMLDGSLPRFYTVVQLASSAVCVGCALTWYIGAHKPATTAQTCLALTVAVELLSIAFSWRVGIFQQWHLSQGVYLVLYGVLILIQGGILWQHSRSR